MESAPSAQPPIAVEPQVQGSEKASSPTLNGVEGSGGLNGIEQKVNGLSLANGDDGEQGPSVLEEQGEFPLHAFCAEGNVEGVRQVLTKGFGSLETLDMTTGCTPIVLAIRNNHVEVVRELLAAGAIVPPPGLTADPVLLSLLYPPHAQGMFGAPQYIPQEFYPQPYFDGNGPQRMMSFPAGNARKESLPSPNGIPPNLPPAEVSKTIPCRNFPNCKYGSACVFFHPRQQPGFFAPSFMPGYDNFNPSFQPMQFYQPQPQLQPQPQPQPQSHVPQQQHQASSNGYQDSSIAQPTSTDTQQPTQTTASNDVPVSDPSEPQHQHEQHVSAPLQTDPSFVPVFIPGAQAITSPQQPPFGLSPLSPTMIPGSIPPPEAFFATSPPNGFMSGGFNPRRQSFQQTMPFGGPQAGSKPFTGGHGKKPSFSGAPRPWGAGRISMSGSGNLGSWKDGVPPPCAFFVQNKCRNGEFCKFPHIDAEGNDCRNPDVIRGVIPPAPPLGRPPRAMRMGNFGPFDPRHQYIPRPGLPQQNGGSPVNGENTNGDSTPESAIAEETQQTQADSQATEPVVEAEKAELPAKPASGAHGPSTGPIARSASQPGAPRAQLQVNGFPSRSHSPAPSNVSFHGNGHPRRGGAGRFPNGNGNGAVNGHAHVNGHGNTNGVNGPRSVSSDAKPRASQRIPGADEFPALGGGANVSPTEKSVAQFSKTAAQVLSAPAPAPPPAAPRATTEASKSDDDHSESGLTMDSDSDSDAVIISVRPSSPAPTDAVSTSQAQSQVQADLKRAAASFASVASSVTAAAAGLAAEQSSAAASATSNGNGTPNGIESSPVALKA